MAQYGGMWTVTQQMQARAAGTWQLAPVQVSYLLIGGGGAGGRGSPAGGGGAGGYLAGTLTATPGVPLTITIGAGGSAAVANYQAGLPGSTTSFSTVSVIGGGGSAGEQAPGQTGYASGGGGGGVNNTAIYRTGVAGTAGIGFAGGNGVSNYSAGGGGGALSVGANATGGGSGGAGGDGYTESTLYPTVTSSTSNTIGTGSKTFTVAAGLQYAANQNLSIRNGSNYMYGLVTSYSGTTLVFNCYFVTGSGTFTSWTINNMYAGGGGGGGFQAVGSGPGRGGTGNVISTGGYGQSPTTVSNATANSGGGGGGGAANNQIGGNGGSGVLIVRVAGAAQATTGSPSVITDGSFYIYTFTASGTITL